MSDETFFKLIDKYLAGKRLENRKPACEHTQIQSGVCEKCYVVIGQSFVNDEDFYSRTTRRSDNRQNKLTHFRNFLQGVEWLKGDDWCITLHDFELFLKTYNSLEKKRKNFLLNKWVLWQLLEMRGVKCECHIIKSEKSNAEHRELGQRCFDSLGWGKIK